MDSSLDQITEALKQIPDIQIPDIELEASKPDVKILTMSEKIKELEYVKRNLEAEYDDLMKYNDLMKKYNDLMKKEGLIDIIKNNKPLEECLIVSIISIITVLESLKKERG
tara:strand:+ start:52 stop:384 length:333 start_codon:yes stop_codon:yes gene_type:complete